jgi:hypothetical protein
MEALAVLPELQRWQLREIGTELLAAVAEPEAGAGVGKEPP